jgi:hypothetical protein
MHVLGRMPMRDDLTVLRRSAAHHLDADVRGPAARHPERARRSGRDIEHAVAHEWAAIVDADFDRATRVDVRHQGPRSERERR